MLFFLIILLLIMFNQAKFANSNEFMTDYLSREKTNAIKGLFVILVIFQHWSQYVELNGIYDEPYLVLQAHLNQMIVAMFLFYSGYGMMESTKAKGIAYIKGIPGKRLLTVLVNFDIAVLIFFVVKSILGETFQVSTILFSLIGWKSLGNSNWYIFVTLVLYCIYFVTFYLAMNCQDSCGREKAIFIGNVAFSLCALLFVFTLMKLNQPNYWYNTAILFAVGTWYSLLKEKIERFVMHNDYCYSFSMFTVAIIYVVSFRYRWQMGIEGYTIWAVAFTVLVVLFTMKISFCNSILNWFGNHVFSVYILQRIPMIIFQKSSYMMEHKYVYLCLVIVSTIFISLIFDYFTGKLSKFIQKKFSK